MYFFKKKIVQVQISKKEELPLGGFLCTMVKTSLHTDWTEEWGWGRAVEGIPEGGDHHAVPRMVQG